MAFGLFEATAGTGYGYFLMRGSGAESAAPIISARGILELLERNRDNDPSTGGRQPPASGA